ncbi:MAG: leucine-rich repeat protein, partial [Clostridia bacterium]|nr:leucine-rich repeat protein [Clostridia bacterium]
MKRRLLPLLILFVMICALGLVGCSGNAYKVEFFDGDVLLYTRLVPKGGSLIDIPDVPEKEGFVGDWSIDDFDEINGNLRVSAVYTRSQYVVNFYVEEDLYLTRKVNRNSRLTNVPAVPEKEGYAGAWSVTDFSLIDRDIDVFAVYTVADVKVTYMADGQVYAVSDVVDGVTVYIPDVPAYPYKNYSSNWVKEENGTEEADLLHVSSSMTVFAHYYITLSLIDSEDETLDAEIDAPVAAPAHGRRVGYDFLGWYADASYRSRVDFPQGFSENTTLYARWLKNNFDEGFTFEDGALTGYYGTNRSPIAPYKYEQADGTEAFVTKVAPQAFEGSDLIGITLPSTVTEIGESAFHNAYDLTEVIFSDGSRVESIGMDAFRDCRSLTGFAFSPFTAEIGVGAFCGCSAVRTYPGLEDSVLETIPEDAFYDNLSVEAFSLPASVKSVGNNAFGNAHSANFSFASDKIVSVGTNAFGDCYRLRAFYAPSLTYVGEGAFSGCRSLTELTVTSDRRLGFLFGEESAEYFYDFLSPADSERDWLPKSLRTVTVTANPKTDTTPAGTLVSYAFFGAKSVKSVDIRGVKVIQESAFRMIDEPEDAAISISLPSGLTDIGDYAFYGRSDLKEISLPATVEHIGREAFAGLDGLESVTIADNNALASVDAFAFSGTGWFADFNGVVRLGRVALGVSDRIGRYELSEEDFVGVDTVAPKAFYGNNRLNKIALSPSVLRVGDEAFGYTYLQEIA